MTDPADRELTLETQKLFAAKLTAAIGALRRLSPQRSEQDQFHMALHNHLGEPAHYILRIDLVKSLGGTPEFKSLLEFVCADRQLKRRFLGRLIGSPVEDSEGVHFVKVSLLRALSQVYFDPESTDPSVMIDDLVSFLRYPHIERHVHVDILNLDMPAETFAIGGFGTLRGFDPVEMKDFPGWVPRPPVDLMFTVETPQFLGFLSFPFQEEIRSRLALLRLGIHSLIACNNFYVQNIRPWEDRIPSSSVWDRVGGRHRDRTVSNGKFDWYSVEGVEALNARFKEFEWNRLNPRRLAIDRLDDGVFKFEAGHPDAILDFSIGLESIYVEPGSRQESAHKMAMRAAKYLGATKEDRLRIFRQMKDIYKARSTLAHGQSWTMNEKALLQMVTAAGLLGLTLRRMTLERRTELDFTELDLG